MTDKERALINAINVVFPDTKTISCIWHIDMNLLKKARPLLSNQIAIARRDNQLLLDRLGFTLPDSPLATQLDRPKTNHEIEKELRALVQIGWDRMMVRWNRIVYADSEDALNQR